MIKNFSTKATKKLEFKFKITAIKGASNECIIEGYANTSSKDRVGDVVLPEAFSESLPTYQKNPVILLNHDWNDVIGRCVYQEVTDKGLFIKARISDTRVDIKTLINEGCYSTFSIGYNEIDADYDESTKTKYIKKLELLEISVVSVPANTEAMFTQIQEKVEPTKPEEAAKNFKTASALKKYISDIKTTVGKGFDDEALFAVIDHFNSQEKEEELMTKDQLIKALTVKTAAAPAAQPAPETAKADPAKPADGSGEQDPVAMLSAKLDALAEAMSQVMAKLEQMGQDEASEDESAGEPAAEPAPEAAAPEAEAPAAKKLCDKCGKEMDGDQCKECMPQEEGQKDLSIEEIDKELADLNSTLQELDEEING